MGKYKIKLKSGELVEFIVEIGAYSCSLERDDLKDSFICFYDKDGYIVFGTNKSNIEYILVEELGDTVADE